MADATDRKDPSVRPSDAMLLIDYSSKVQAITADSTPAAEAMGIHHGVRNGLVLATAIDEVTLAAGRGDGGEEPPLRVANDNAAAVSAYGRGHSEKLAHYGKTAGLKLMFVKDCIDSGAVQIGHVRTHQDLADVFTKVLGRMDFQRLRDEIGVRLIKGQDAPEPEVDVIITWADDEQEEAGKVEATEDAREAHPSC